MATEQPTFRFDNGDKVRDRITGLEGVVVARTDWHYGCKRYIVQPQELKDGKPVDSSSFDEEQLETVQAQAVSTSKRDTGGPAPDPQRRPEVTR